MSSGHPLKTRAEQDRISSFLHETTRRSNSRESQSHRSSRHRRHPLDPVESDSDPEHRNRHRSSKSRRRRSNSRSPTSEDDNRRHRSKRHEKSSRHRRHSSSSSGRSSTSRDRKRKISMEKYEPKPTSTIIMQHIPSSFDEHELLSELSIAKVPVQEIRMIHRRDPSTNLQTAYVEFNSIQDAEQWMNLTQGTFLLNDHAVTLKHRFDDESTSSSFNHHNDNNSLSKSSRNNINELRMRDWDCYKCGVQNFKRRDHCFNCHISREGMCAQATKGRIII